MGFFTPSSNMALPIPNVGQDPGPDYASNINSSLTLIDQHDHSLGKGVQITPFGLNINTNLNIGSNFLYNVGGTTMVSQLSTPANQTTYVSGTDLYFIDGNGNNVRITQAGGIAGSPGSITNLTAPASASYVAASKTFVWQSNTNVAANLDAASILLRNITPNSTFAVTLNPPASLASNYNLILPTIPGSTLFLTLDTFGNMGTATNILGTQIAAGTLTGAQLVNGTLTTTQINASAGILGTQLANNTIDLPQLTATTINSVTGSSSSYSNSTASFTTIATSGSVAYAQNRPIHFTMAGPHDIIGTDSGSGSIISLALFDSVFNIARVVWNFTIPPGQTVDIPFSSLFAFIQYNTNYSSATTFTLQGKVLSGTATITVASGGGFRNINTFQV